MLEEKSRAHVQQKEAMFAEISTRAVVQVRVEATEDLSAGALISSQLSVLYSVRCFSVSKGPSI